MEDINYLVKNLLKNNMNRALEETIDLMRIAQELHVREFMEIYSIVYPEEYERKKHKLEAIQQNLCAMWKNLVQMKKEMPIY